MRRRTIIMAISTAVVALGLVVGSSAVLAGSGKQLAPRCGSCFRVG